MKAVLLYAYGDLGQLRYEDTDMPRYGDDKVLVKVRATSRNRREYVSFGGGIFIATRELLNN
jgi:NADPH:quinone reductase-like Zn-dependent oxidoreductase